MYIRELILSDTDMVMCVIHTVERAVMISVFAVWALKKNKMCTNSWALMLRCKPAKCFK